ncbi:MAG TPA: hypothetical protein PLD20_05730 [Blastocatellia bacterium]|nr:hypothetical protein [Blastocatellia bacterium]HMX25688.1 hypothetical protein [Blastocatellia bacterium]HMY76925.1 hypothetical protein [Blastocatellia bacterium]HMZ17407.1 hypothetical protein [Blastocatellia bacterium]HNG29221.1 hypothetical protein [Blastocatellia bacterium]
MTFNEVIETIVSKIEDDLNGRSGMSLDDVEEEILSDIRGQWRAIVFNSLKGYRCYPDCISSGVACGQASIPVGHVGRSAALSNLVTATTRKIRELDLWADSPSPNERLVEIVETALSIAASVGMGFERDAQRKAGE